MCYATEFAIIIEHADESANVIVVRGRERASQGREKKPVEIQDKDFTQEFDPGSGRTLAACLTHASRTESVEGNGSALSGGRVRNA